MSWGSGAWGSTPWGGAPSAAPLTVNLGLERVNIFAIDLLELVFETDIKVTAALLSPSSYAVVPLESSGAVNVQVLEVRAEAQAAVDHLFLVVTPFTDGGIYTVSILTSVTSRERRTLVGSMSAVMTGRRTKIDSICSTRPPLYNLRPSSVVRNILNAIGREDDRIGGSQDEGEEIIR